MLTLWNAYIAWNSNCHFPNELWICIYNFLILFRNTGIFRHLRDKIRRYSKQEGNWMEIGKKNGKTWNILMSDYWPEWLPLLKYSMKMCLHFQRMVLFYICYIWSNWLMWCSGVLVCIGCRMNTVGVVIFNSILGVVSFIFSILYHPPWQVEWAGSYSRCW